MIGNGDGYRGPRWRVRMMILLLIMALGLTACERLGGGGSDSEQPDTPQALAKQNSDDAAKALEESAKGVDEDGEKLWRQDAREFFDQAANPRNRTFELPWQWAAEYTRQAYEAGAPKVWMVYISEIELGGDTYYVSDSMVVELPQDPVVRKALIEAYNEAAGIEDDPTLAIVDAGQAYLYIVGD